MINLKKTVFCLIIFLLFLTNNSFAIKDSLFATIGNKAITRSDVLNEVKSILILSGKAYTPDQKDFIQAAAIQAVIKRNIKKIEIERYELNYDPKDLTKQLNIIAENLNMDLEKLKSIFDANEINFEIVVDQIKTELLWNSLIFNIYGGRLNVNQIEIEEQLKSFQNDKNITEYLVSEIIIASVPSSELENTIKEIENKIKNEGFESVAINLSLSETAIKGGDLGWLNENEISKDFKTRIEETPVGEVSSPIFLPQGILFFKIRDKRQLKEFKNLEEAKNEMVKAEKRKILNMHSLSHYDNLKRSTTINYY